MGELVRCVACGEVQWNLRLVDSARPEQKGCRLCGADLRAERRRPGRHFDVRLTGERRDLRPGSAV
jgi:hypothetical protein